MQKARKTVRDIVIDAIILYVTERGRLCFTYYSFMPFFFTKVREKKLPYVKWHTISRLLRKLSEEMLLERRYDERSRRIYFCVSDELLALRNLRKEEVILGLV